MRRTVYLALLVACAAVSIFGSVTLAEGQRTSYMSMAIPGFESQNWWDNHIDAWSTAVTFENCTDHYRPTIPVNATIELWYVRDWLPDVSKGLRTLNCYNAFSTGSWGEMTDVGNYHFLLKYINGWESDYWLDVEHVYMSW